MVMIVGVPMVVPGVRVIVPLPLRVRDPEPMIVAVPFVKELPVLTRMPVVPLPMISEPPVGANVS